MQIAINDIFYHMVLLHLKLLIRRCCIIKVKSFLPSLYSNSDSYISQCSLDASAQLWTCSSGHSNFSCSVDKSGSGISCLDKLHCPYAEESQQIHISVYVRTDFLVENYSKDFYLSEIGETCAALIFFCLFLFVFYLTVCFVSTLNSET